MFFRLTQLRFLDAKLGSACKIWSFLVLCWGISIGFNGFRLIFYNFFFKFFVFVLGLERGSNVGGLLAVFCLACVQLSCMTSAKKKKKKNSFFFFLLREWLRLRFIVLYRKRYYFFLLNSHVIIYDSQWKSHWLLFYVD